MVNTKNGLLEKQISAISIRKIVAMYQVFIDTNWKLNQYNQSKYTSFHFTHHIAAVPYPFTASYTHYKLIMQKLSIADRCRWYVASKRQKAAGDSVWV